MTNLLDRTTNDTILFRKRFVENRFTNFVTFGNSSLTSICMPEKRYVIIVAGGSGVRMGGDIPKQFIELCGRPILMRTIEVFSKLPISPKIIIVLPQLQIEKWKILCTEHNFGIKHTVVAGGTERFYSVQNGLQAIDDDDSIVAIHDGVRPLVSSTVIEECYRVAEIKGNAIPVMTPVESVRLIKNDSSIAFPRSNVMLVQTPQVFNTGLIKQCYRQPYSINFTDDASVVEARGEKIFTVEGNRENIKITNQSDLLIAEALLQKEKL